MADKPEDKQPLAPQSLAEAQLARGIQKTEPAPASPTAVKERPLYILGPERLRGAEFERLIYVANPGEGVTIEDLLRPECWASVTNLLRPWSHIEVRAEDGSYYAELLVTGVDRAWAKVEVLNFKELTTKDVSLTVATRETKYEIKHTPGLHWHVIRKSDRHVIKDGLQLRSQAEDALREHLKTVPQ